MAQPAIERATWWQRGLIYQVYPRSFQDSNGDGIGDLPGIRSRLDYLQWLGVDAIWVSPIFPSPMADFGYDVADYVGVDPIFGTLADLDALVRDAHARDIRVLLDFVPNHTSDRHPWFLASRSSRTDARRDWYIWADPRPDGGPPNNWLSMFGGGAWEWDEATGQFYLHTFLREQPDLNWRNPDVRKAMFDALRFWLDRGVDGFRVDVLWMLVKDEELRDNPPNPAFVPERDRSFERLLGTHTEDRAETREVVWQMRRILDEYDGDRVLIGEIYLPIERLVRYYGDASGPRGAHLPFNFQLLSLPWRADELGAAIRAYEAALPPDAWPNWVLGNHDRPRIASRVGPEQARVAAMLLLTLRGTPTLYNGDELGMENVEVAPELTRDPASAERTDRGRDPERTPMRWDAGPKAGFTTGEPWLPVGADVDRINVATERTDPRSMLALHRRLIELRRGEPALSIGAWAPVAASGDLLAYERRFGDRRIGIALNLGSGVIAEPFPAVDAEAGPVEILASTHLDREGAAAGPLELRPNEGVIVRLG